jgi:hypothetical protein
MNVGKWRMGWTCPILSPSRRYPITGWVRTSFSHFSSSDFGAKAATMEAAFRAVVSELSFLTRYLALSASVIRATSGSVFLCHAPKQ